MKFPVNIIADKTDGGFVVTFPDIPEAILLKAKPEKRL